MSEEEKTTEVTPATNPEGTSQQVEDKPTEAAETKEDSPAVEAETDRDESLVNPDQPFHAGNPRKANVIRYANDR